jgi:DNA-binding CsgD family transcriptional regulator
VETAFEVHSPAVLRAGLSPDDLEQMLSVVEAVGAARDPDEFSRVAIEQVSLVVPCDVVTLNEVEPASGRIVYLAHPASYTIPPEVEREWLPLADRHPLFEHYVTTGDGSARRISDFLSQEEFHASAIYRRFYGPLGVEYQMAITLPAPRPVVVAMALSRSARDFSERDRQVLNVLRPHLVQAWYNARDQRQLRALLSAASEATADWGGQLIMLADPLVEVTPGALVSLYRHFGPPSPSAPLPRCVDRWVEGQRKLLGQDPLELQEPLRVGGRNGSVVLHYLPSQRDHPGAILLRSEVPVPKRRNLETLGLTDREAEIVECLISGETNAAIGHTLHVSPGTVKKHLDNIYTKLGVRGRGRLTAFVLDVLERQADVAR